jgi:hypothetical protein
MKYTADYTVQQIWGCILLWKSKYVYLVGFALQNIKLAFKLSDWLWFKKNWLYCFMEAGRKQWTYMN